MIKQLCENVLKGIGVGASMLVPGVSGGTMAIILGIYDNLISAISSFFRDVKKHAFLLSTFLLGSLIGIFLFAKALGFLTTTFQMPMMYLFLGAIAGSLPTLLNKANIKEVQPKQRAYYSIYIIMGMAIVFLMARIPSNFFVFDENNALVSYIMLIVAGLFAAVALVLPGISVSYVLLMMGMYESTMKAIEQLDILFLLPLLIGGVVGVAASTRMLENAMKNHTRITYLIIIGFLVASMFEVIPKVFPVGIELIVCPVTFIVGVCLILLLSKKVNKDKA